jgi:hypothetical protein
MSTKPWSVLGISEVKVPIYITLLGSDESNVVKIRW